MRTMWSRILLGTAASAFLLLGTATTAEARHDRNCSKRLNGEFNKLERDVRRHGVFSRQAENRRIKISRLQSQCGFTARRGRGPVWNQRDHRRAPIFRFEWRDHRRRR